MSELGMAFALVIFVISLKVLGNLPYYIAGTPLETVVYAMFFAIWIVIFYKIGIEDWMR